MPISWKSGDRFRPEVLLAKLDETRTETAEGGSAFHGFAFHNLLPAIESMLRFPPATRDVNRSTLLWKAIAHVRGPLTKQSVALELNKRLSQELATKELTYVVATTISLDRPPPLESFTFEGVKVAFLGGGLPKKFGARPEVIQARYPHLPAEPDGYARLLATTKAKSATGALTRSLETIDLFRALWCLMTNPQMELIGDAWRPINSLRLGPVHTVHLLDGKPATQSFWYEPNFTEAAAQRHKHAAMIVERIRIDMRRLTKCSYRDTLVDALVRYARAFDERDQNTAFLKLWGAIETLVCPGKANHELLVRRCSFLFQDHRYHRQMLEHLREYRNSSVHAGDESERAKTHCFQLQAHFSALIEFHLGNVRTFGTLSEANEFLDLPPNEDELARRQRLLTKARRFVVPLK